MKSALEIAQEAKLRPITEIAAAAGIEPHELEAAGQYRGKVLPALLERLQGRSNGKLVIVTAITPTKAGEGKTTTSVALTMGLGKLGKKVMLCLREPSMGWTFTTADGAVVTCDVDGNGTGAAKVPSGDTRPWARAMHCSPRHSWSCSSRGHIMPVTATSAT